MEYIQSDVSDFFYNFQHCLKKQKKQNEGKMKLVSLSHTGLGHDVFRSLKSIY